jgi:hypothetical protein
LRQVKKNPCGDHQTQGELFANFQKALESPTSVPVELAKSCGKNRSWRKIAIALIDRVAISPKWFLGKGTAFGA